MAVIFEGHLCDETKTNILALLFMESKKHSAAKEGEAARFRGRTEPGGAVGGSERRGAVEGQAL